MEKTNMPPNVPKRKINLTLNITSKEANRISCFGNSNPMGLETEEFEELKKHEKQLFNWLEKNDKNPYLYVNDPIKALQEAVPELDPKLLEKLKSKRSNQKPPDTAAPEIEIKKFIIKVNAK